MAMCDMWLMRHKYNCQGDLLRNLKEWRRILFASNLNPVSLNLDVMARVLATILDYKGEPWAS